MAMATKIEGTTTAAIGWDCIRAIRWPVAVARYPPFRYAAHSQATNSARMTSQPTVQRFTSVVQRHGDVRPEQRDDLGQLLVLPRGTPQVVRLVEREADRRRVAVCPRHVDRGPVAAAGPRVA